MSLVVPTPQQQALYLPLGVSLPREQLASIQHVLNHALRPLLVSSAPSATATPATATATTTMARSPPPPPYNPSPREPQWYRPRMDLFESPAVVTATFELPGLRKQDIHIDVVDGRMVVVGERRDEPVRNPEPPRRHEGDEDMHDDDDDGMTHTALDARREHSRPRSASSCHEEDSGAPRGVYDPPAGYTVREIKRGRFRRVLQLPAGTKLEDIKASMHDGILTVTFPGVPRPVVRSVPIA